MARAIKGGAKKRPSNRGGSRQAGRKSRTRKPKPTQVTQETEPMEQPAGEYGEADLATILESWGGQEQKQYADIVVDVGDSVTVRPLSDVHWPMTNVEALTVWRQSVMDSKDAKVLLVGDLFESLRTTEMNQLNSLARDGGIRATIEDAAVRAVDELAAFLAPIKDKIVCAVPGNHGLILKSGQTSDQALMEKLGIGHLYRPVYALVRFRFKDGQTKVALVHHYGGGGTGSSLASDLNSFRKTEGTYGGEGVDALVHGHSHRLYVVPSEHRPLQIGHDGKVTQRTPIIYMRTGAFRDHDPLSEDYAVKKLFSPTLLGWSYLRWAMTAAGRVITNSGVVLL